MQVVASLWKKHEEWAFVIVSNFSYNCANTATISAILFGMATLFLPDCLQLQPQDLRQGK